MIPLLLATVIGVGPPWRDPITAGMREALGHANKVHNLMPVKVVDDAVDALHRAIARENPGVFVPMAISHLIRLAPKDVRTRVLLREALAKGWMEPGLTRGLLVRAGDDSGPHVKALMKGLEGDAKARRDAIQGLGVCGAAAAPALPMLRGIVEKAKAPADDYRRAYTLSDEVPDHVRAHWAIGRIEAGMKGTR